MCLSIKTKAISSFAVVVVVVVGDIRFLFLYQEFFFAVKVQWLSLITITVYHYTVLVSFYIFGFVFLKLGLISSPPTAGIITSK